MAVSAKEFYMIRARRSRLSDRAKEKARHKEVTWHEMFMASYKILGHTIMPYLKLKNLPTRRSARMRRTDEVEQLLKILGILQMYIYI